MELITEDSTIEEFTREANWLVEDPGTGVIYQMRVSTLHVGSYYIYVIQSGDKEMPDYVRRSLNGPVIISSRLALLDAIQGKCFSVG